MMSGKTMLRSKWNQVSVWLVVVSVIGGAALWCSAYVALGVAVITLTCVALVCAPIRRLLQAGERTVETPVVVIPEKDPARLEGCGKLVSQLVTEGRYSLLLRKEIVENLQPFDQQVARQEMEECMAIVPAGRVMMEPWQPNDRDDEEPAGRLISVESLYVDRYTVTNGEYQAFVDAGGYEQPTLWNPDLLPAVLEFNDQTGYPGPRFWKSGRFLEGTEHHPVVGVSWYEAEAYARWVGKRLPTSPEWVKSGAWPVEAGGMLPKQRKYPWGEAMDRGKANLWGSGFGTTCSVYQLSSGGSVNGIQQLIGNVWEWTTTDFVPKDETGRSLLLAAPMKTIRGGAFDTYFDQQATCHFQSGDTLMKRKHNIGFRCALSCCDVHQMADPCEFVEELIVA